MIGGRRPITGRKPGDRRVRVERPHAQYFRYTGHNQLVARREASMPRTPLGRSLRRAKTWMLGRPLASDEEIGERLPKRLALPIFSSDAISSSAYATEEILRVLVLAGAGALLLSIEVAIAISLLLAVVAISYRQVCYAFPNGGGAYAVARQELRPHPRARRRGRPADRLRHDGRCLHVVGNGPADLDRPGARGAADRGRRRGHRADHHREPAGPPGVRQHLRGPDIPVRDHGPRDHRVGGGQHR